MTLEHGAAVRLFKATERVRGWPAFLVSTVPDWLERGRQLERSAPQELCVRTLTSATSAVTHAIGADRGRAR
jgi:hypothetical protein